MVFKKGHKINTMQNKKLYIKENTLNIRRKRR